MAVYEPYARQVRLLVDVLPFVSRERRFALKGGTAINMFGRDLRMKPLQRAEAIKCLRLTLDHYREA